MVNDGLHLIFGINVLDVGVRGKGDEGEGREEERGEARDDAGGRRMKKEQTKRRKKERREK